MFKTLKFSKHFFVDWFLSDKLSQPESSPAHIGGLWANISHSLRASVEAAIGFERPPKGNHWHDEASAEKNDAYKRMLQSAATRATAEDYRQKRREERRLIRRKKTARKRRQLEEIEMFRNFSKAFSV